jgi:predicted P-loop ATPase
VEVANKKYGWHDDRINYTTKLVKNLYTDKMEWDISIINNNHNIRVMVDLVSPDICQSVIHMCPFLGDQITKIEPKHALHIRDEVEKKALGLKIQMKEINEAINHLSYQNQFNPLLDYFESRFSDPDLEELHVLDNWFQLTMGAEDSDVIKKIGRRWVLQAVARASHPGRYNESVLVMIDEDGGVGKTRMIQMLPPDPSYAYEGSPNMGNTQSFAQTLSGSWIVDLSEGDAVDKHSVETNKRMITTSVDKYVPKFENYNVQVDRPFVFTMTTNNSTPLLSTDLSIIRRFQPVKTKGFDAKAFVKIRDQLWLEAHRELKRLDSLRQPGDKDPYVLMESDITEFREYCQQFVQASVLRDQLIDYFANPIKTLDDYYTVDEMQNICKKLNKYATAQQIKQIMCNDLGFVKVKKDIKIVVDGNITILRGHWVYLSPNFAATHPTGVLCKSEGEYEIANPVAAPTKEQERKLRQAQEAFMQTEEYKAIMGVTRQ